jgi:hypothetical protein
MFLFIAFTGLFFGHPFIYQKWAGLGGGTMTRDGKIAIFGDLAQLTSAAKCEKAIIVGTDVCDPWGRLFNQNPAVAELFRAIKLTNVYVVGILSLIILYITLFIMIKKLKIQSIAPYIMFATPACILAIDRGNEIITLILITIGLFELYTKSSIRQTIGAISLVSASIFKLWPTALVCFILILFWKRVNLIPKCILVFSGLYWIPRINLVLKMLNVTDHGHPFGYSFGLKLIGHSQLAPLYRVVLVVLSLSLLFVFVRLTKSSLDQFIQSTNGLTFLYCLTPLMLTFSLIWAFGDSYIYRVIMLVPLVLLLSHFKICDFAFSRFLLSAILVTCIVSLTPLVLVVTSALALYFVYLSLLTVSAQHKLKTSILTTIK